MRRLLIQTSDTYAEGVGAVGAGLAAGQAEASQRSSPARFIVCPGSKPTDGTGKNDPETLVVATGYAAFADADDGAMNEGVGD
jgi:hypothetical protein